MTRIEFDNQVRSMKAARNAALNEVATMTAEIKEEIAAKHRQIDDLHKEVCKLRQSAQGLHQRRIKIETEWGGADCNIYPRERAEHHEQPRRGRHHQHSVRAAAQRLRRHR